MTENEAINVLKMVEAHGCLVIEAKIMAIQALEEIQQYRAIGAVEEFKALKEKKNFLPIANITLNKKDMQEIVDEKIKEIELDIQKIGAKAIDEFVEKIKKKGIEDSWNCNEFYGDSCVLTYCEECENDFLREIDEMAERLKAGEKNE